MRLARWIHQWLLKQADRMDDWLGMELTIDQFAATCALEF